MTTMSKAKVIPQKSGIRKLKPGEVLFYENDHADSLYIIQRGQIRLYLSKGRGFVDIAVLRAGEVIGEMAYFDAGARKRSCSASAIINTDVIEISFNAFDKTMSGLNPWFKTIVTTLADRLRKTNQKVKSLESNSVSFGKDGKVSDYRFFSNADVIKLIALIYMAAKAHGEVKDGGLCFHLSKLKFYGQDIFGVGEIKIEEFISLLKSETFIDLLPDADNLPMTVRLSDIEIFRGMLLFFNNQKFTADDKKLKISYKCEMILKKFLDQLKNKVIKDGVGVADFSVILDDFKGRKVPILQEDLSDAIRAGFCDDIIVGDNNVLSVNVFYDKLKKIYPSIKMMNVISRFNESKSKSSY